jgi:hypothetical protein
MPYFSFQGSCIPNPNEKNHNQRSTSMLQSLQQLRSCHFKIRTEHKHAKTLFSPWRRLQREDNESPCSGSQLPTTGKAMYLNEA